MTNQVFHWTEERTETLRRLWGEGLSASEIARRLGNPSRSSVLGKVNRLGLSGRVTTHRDSARTRSPQRRTNPNRAFVKRIVLARRLHDEEIAAAIEAAEPVPQYNDIARKTLAELEPGDCRFIPGDPFAHGPIFCGLPRMIGSPYCAGHHAIAYVSTPVRTRKPKSAPVEVPAETVEA